MPSFLALDIASHLGFCRYKDGEGRSMYGSERFRAEAIAQRAVQFVDWLLPTLAANEITHVGVEALVPVIGTTSLDSLVWLHGSFFRLSEICARRRIELLPIGVAAWRSHFLGVTRAPSSIADRNKRRVWLKRRCVDECRARGFDPKNDNEADAIGIMDYLRSMNDAEFARASRPQLGKAAA